MAEPAASGGSVPTDPEALAEVLWAAGFVAAEEEADELLAAAAGDRARLDALVARRLTGEPLAWITGTVEFCGLNVRVDPGVYVPRWQSEVLARRAAALLPADGTAVDVCTGTGAIALVLATAHPGATVIGVDVDEASVACARANGVDARCGDLFAPLPAELRGRVDVVVGSVPYVPTGALGLLQRDTLAFESPRSYDGGPDGTSILRRVLQDARTLLRPGGALLLELGGDEADLLAPTLTDLGYAQIEVIRDEDADTRGLVALLTEADS
ncbi:peptide chain release factor N(5)-glutamine methyltransferase [Aquihabitans sp. G128]|uniref:N5-glutamine methyltransferase family protein n=1 Tax=Aquihabitans sp. G128 TaxID=2849779 RepID=UPI001C2152BF|nr:HemK/PrmC family methyltransferase [Aquihabitans sp. G128]QXC59636.1 peptide chain release factor N(5)-glutamine methyltransferase [Aquihabitans sp. G128]